ncbi:CUE5 [Candida jiufengensis]|uniref:CUE5 n=1 Tax=Candida jiufengensis TaxID=497108 RepID=UPI002224D9AD|nr:CUE5 [Candida jiufengensis]KAI5955682.1 CUE5 [Candida jiufengensis]
MVKKETLKEVDSKPLDSIDDNKGETKKDIATTEESETKDKIQEESKEDKSKTTTENDKISNKKTEELAIEDIPLNDDADEVVKKTEVETTTLPPPPPSRPKDPVQQTTQDLKDAFPSIEEKIITAVLIASQGNPEPAFSALLYISDPSFKPDIPVYQTTTTTSKNTSASNKNESIGFTDDEILARKLQKEFELEDERRRRRHQDRNRRDRNERDQQASNRQHRQNLNDYERSYYEEEESPDEFDQIKETFTQGLEEAKTTLNGWVSGLAKKFDSATANRQQQQQEQRDNATTFGSKSHREGGNNFGNLGGTRYYDELYKGKKTRFDEDPEIISSDFHDKIRLNKESSTSANDDDEEAMASPHLPTRPRNSTELQSDTPSAIQSDTKKDTLKKKQPWQPEDPPADSDAFLVTDSEEEDIEVTSEPVKSEKK